MSRSAPSIRQMLLLITGALTLIIALLALSDIYGNWQRLTEFETLKNASLAGDRLFRATERLSVESDVALAMLEASDRETVENLRPRLLESRLGVDAELRASLSALSRFGFADLTNLMDTMAAHLNAIEALRPKIDAATAAGRPPDQGALAGDWSSEVPALIRDSADLWTTFVGHFANVDPIVTQHLWFRHLLRTISEYAGRERSAIGELIAENTDPAPETVAELQRGQGIVTQSWQMGQTIAEQSGLFPAIASAFKDANSHYATTHEMVESLAYVPGARQGGTYPIAADFWFELSAQATDSLTALRDVTIAAASAYIDILIGKSQRQILVAAAIFLGAVALCGASFWIVIGRVIKPINRMVDALLRETRRDGAQVQQLDGVRDEIGKLAIVLRAFQRSVQDAKRASAELARSQTRLSAVVDHAIDGLFTISPKGKIDGFNPACERIFGYRAEEMIGGEISRLIPDTVASNGSDKPSQTDGPDATAAQPFAPRELTARRKDGTVFPVDLSISTFRLDDGTHMAGIVRDVTRRRQNQEELMRHTRALERSNKELDDFAYIASHDLKEPLRGIHNHSRFLLEDNGEKLDPESVGRLNRLVYLSQRMERLVNDLLYFSRLGRQELAVQATDLNDVIQDIESTLDVFMEERHARIEIPKALPVIICDKPRVAELFRNLITNAIKYNDKDDKIVEIGHLATKRGRDGARLENVFYVRDNGRGIGPEFHEEIFRIFRRLQGAAEGEEGTGVGLTFVKKIVERHGGRIWVESEPGNGATFYFTLEEPHHHDAEHRSKVAA